MDSALAVVAIGGNSLIKSKDRQEVEDQHEAIRQTMRHVARLMDHGFRIVVTHGNGPQVGFILRRSDIARKVSGMHQVPLVNCVADTQGSIGYQIQQSLDDELAKRGRGPGCVTLVTQVVVDGVDPEFAAPSKPIGEFYTLEEARKIAADYPGWTFGQDSGRGIRRVVPSPRPLEIVELEAIRTLLAAGQLVVAAGGGGIPVVRTPAGLRGVAAVIDKDFASALLARELGAQLLIISTAVERVSLDFGKPGAREVSQMSAAQAREYAAQGHFAPGSMLPKILAAAEFLEGGGREVIITSPEYIDQAVGGDKGTHILP